MSMGIFLCYYLLRVILGGFIEQEQSLSEREREKLTRAATPHFE